MDLIHIMGETISYSDDSGTFMIKMSAVNKVGTPLN